MPLNFDLILCVVQIYADAFYGRR